MTIAPGTGESSYISGHIGCVAIKGTSTEDNITFPTKNQLRMKYYVMMIQ